MKVRTVIISVVVSASLVAGVGYGAYYAIRGKATPVEVVPVANVNQYYGWGDEDGNTVYGTITSQVAQTVSLNQDYQVADIYVQEGQKVKEGDALFSYDMTLPELELEMAKLNLQTQELTMVRLEKDLEKLKKSKVTASLESVQPTFTTAADTAEADEIVDDTTPNSQGTASEGQTEQTTEAESGSTGDATSDGSLSVEQVQQVANPQLADDDGTATIRNSVASYEQLMASVDVLFQTYRDSLSAADIRDAMKELVSYYRKNLADEQQTEETDADGNAVTVRSYQLKESVKQVLNAEELSDLEQYAKKMNEYHAAYVEMLIQELDPENPGDFAALVKEAEEEYANLETSVQAQVTNLSRLAERKTQAEAMADSGASAQSVNDGQSVAGNETGATETEESETEVKQEYTVTVKNGYINGTQNVTALVHPGDEVTVTASGEEQQTFLNWYVKPDTVQLADAWSETTTFTMPAEDVQIEALYEEKISAYVENFLTFAEQALGADGVTKDSYDTEALKTAIAYYQANLGEEGPDVVDGSTASWDEYVLKQAVTDYLNANEKSYEAEHLQQRYQALCMTLVKTLVDGLDYQSLSWDAYNAAKDAYDSLGETWRTQLDASVTASDDTGASSQTGQTVSQNGQTANIDSSAAAEGEASQTESEEGTGTAPAAALTYGEKLGACEVILKIQDIAGYQSGQPDLLIAYLTEVKSAYLALSDSQKAVVWNSDTLISLLKQYGLWEQETETPNPNPGFDDGGGDFGGDGYTAEQLRELIDDKEQDIKECDLDIREAKLKLSQQQRVVDGKTVTATMDGTVVSLGSSSGTGDSDDSYFLKIVNETGLFAKGSMNELSLQQIHVGDTISGQTDSGMSFTAVIKEISQYPDPSGASYMSDSQNSNASYYPFYALIEDTEDLSEGDNATLQLSGDTINDPDAIYLEDYFIRTEKDGRNYVYMKGEDGTLTKQYVTTGKKLTYGGTEITSGLTKSDRIAFPYGDDVKEGAPTEDVDQLEDAYS
ncbi:MAG: biotin/lipoyl-binding protein [Lachnospiraceae bacterium]|nr:biotin/lipoyl-binding protein [Lachnospiraceae bacterium]